MTFEGRTLQNRHKTFQESSTVHRLNLLSGICHQYNGSGIGMIEDSFSFSDITKISQLTEWTKHSFWRHLWDVVLLPRNKMKMKRKKVPPGRSNPGSVAFQVAWTSQLSVDLFHQVPMLYRDCTKRHKTELNKQNPKSQVVSWLVVTWILGYLY